MTKTFQSKFLSITIGTDLWNSMTKKLTNKDALLKRM